MGVVILVLINPLELNMVVPFYGVWLSADMVFEFYLAMTTKVSI